MAAVDPGFADWLKERALFTTAAAASIDAAWAGDAGESEIVTPFAIKSDAHAEGARQIAFLGGPLAIDLHVVPGLRSDLYGRAVTIESERLGYAGGVPAFVIGVEEAEDREQTVLTVLRAL